MTTSKQIFAKNLKRYMEQSNINQKDLAAAIGISTATMNEYLTAKKYPRIDKIQKLADYFRINKSDLIEDKENEKKPTINSELSAKIDRLNSENRSQLEKYLDFLISSQDKQ